jgi:uncharacterized membrane protein YkoI
MERGSVVKALGNFNPFQAVLIICLAQFASIAQADTPQTVTMHQIPPAARSAVQRQAGEDKLGPIQRLEADGEVTYTATVTNKDGQDHEFAVGEDGTLLRIEVKLSDTPPEVQKTIQAQIGQGSLESIEKTLEEGKTNFDVEMTTKDGADRSFTVALDGRLVSVQMSLQELPPAVQKTIQAHLGGGKLGDIYRLIENGDVSYDAEVDHQGQTRDVMVAPDGKLQSMQVFLSETPPPVQKTIAERLGNGKLVRIDQSFESAQGPHPFEVEGRKDGKAFNFSVGPRGRFLGLDN